MPEYYNIKTVGDLIKELNTFDKDMPIMHAVIGPLPIARVTVQNVNEYAVGGKVVGKHKAVIIR